MADRIGALIVKDRKLLLVTGYEESFYWSPGGKLHGEESHGSCLARELEEELGVEMTSMKHFLSYEGPDDKNGSTRKAVFYLVTVSGSITPGKEITKAEWFSAKELQGGKISLAKRLQSRVIPLLVEKGLI